MPTGKVKVWSEKAFGFIAPDDGGLNIADVVEALPIGARVQFNERPSRKKPGTLEAYDVTLTG